MRDLIGYCSYHYCEYAELINCLLKDLSGKQKIQLSSLQKLALVFSLQCQLGYLTFKTAINIFSLQMAPTGVSFKNRSKYTDMGPFGIVVTFCTKQAYCI